MKCDDFPLIERLDAIPSGSDILNVLDFMPAI